MKHFSMLIKPASGICNLRCDYCFYHDVISHRSGTNFGIMDQATTDILIQKTLDLFKEDATVTFAFQGGEPLCAGLDYFEHFVDQVERRKKPHHVIYYAIQTNGTLLDRRWAAFFHENDFLVGVSLDGFKENHDTFRHDQKGEKTYQTVMAAIGLLKEYRIRFNVLTVLTASLAREPKRLYDFYRKEGLQHVQLIPCLPPLHANGGHDALTPEAFASFYQDFFDAWYEDFERGTAMSVTLFDNVIPMFANIPPQQCGYLGFCAMQFVVEADGSVYPCDFYVLDRYRAGNIRDDEIVALMRAERVVSFLRQERTLSKVCLNCRFQTMCYGQCKRMSICYYRDDYCGYQKFLEHAESRMRAIAGTIRQ